MMITFVSGNTNKITEFVKIVESKTAFKVNSIQSSDLLEIQADSSQQIVEHKCREAMNKFNCSVVVEDTSLCFNAFDGLPGAYVKWFLKAIKSEGLYRMLDGFVDKTAVAKCTIALGDVRSDKVFVFEGICNGQIVKPRGPRSFGWDSCFQPTNNELTFAEMGTDEKNKISHRSNAIDKLIKHLNENQT